MTDYSIQFPTIEGIYSIGPRERRRAILIVDYISGTHVTLMDRLRKTGIDHYVPMQTEWKKRSAKEVHQRKPKTEMKRPLIPGIAIAEVMDAADGYHAIMAHSQVYRVHIPTARQQERLSAQIELIREREASGEFDDTIKKGRKRIKRGFDLGSRVKIKSGPLAELFGIIQEIRQNDRYRLVVDFIGGSTSVEVESDQVETAVVS